jgi:hypothetical protein
VYNIIYDFGTSSVKTCLFEIDSEIRLVTSSAAGYGLYTSDDGGAEQDTEEWWTALCSTTRNLFVKSGIRPEDVEGFCKRWATKGIGWFAEVADDVWIQGRMYKLVFAYWGTSTYDSTEMSRLLDYLKQDMENMGLPIPLSKKEELRLLSKLPKAS